MIRPANTLVLLSALAFAPGCASSQEAKPAETPASTPSAASAEPAPAESAAAEPTAAAPTPPPAAPKKDDAIPDDYSITAGDCAALGHQYGLVARSDQMAALSPKLKEKKRAQAEASIEKVVSKLEENWISSCQNTLVGKVGDRKSLKCALNSESVKAFDICLNGEEGATTNKPAGKSKKK